MSPTRDVAAIVLALSTTLVAIAGSVASGIAPYAGNWLLEGASGFDYISLEAEGRCMLIGGENGGGAFLGAQCSYTSQENVITIAETWDNGGVRQRLPRPVVIHYIPDRDVLRLVSVPEQPEFHRTANTPDQVYESKRK
jgi:hypothetical protein